MNIFLTIVFGIISGTLSGMGMGGGTALIPLLTIFLNYNQTLAQCFNLFSFLPTAIISIIIHSKHHLIKWKLAIFISLVGIVFCLLGSYLANLANEFLLKKLFGYFLICLSIFQFVLCFVKKNNNKN